MRFTTPQFIFRILDSNDANIFWRHCGHSDRCYGRCERCNIFIYKYGIKENYNIIKEYWNVAYSDVLNRGAEV